MRSGRRQEDSVKMEVEIRTLHISTKKIKDCWMSPEARSEGWRLGELLQKKPALLTPWLQVSGLQNPEGTNIYCFKWLSLWWLLKAALGNKYLKFTVQFWDNFSFLFNFFTESCQFPLPIYVYSKFFSCFVVFSHLYLFKKNFIWLRLVFIVACGI